MANRFFMEFTEFKNSLYDKWQKKLTKINILGTIAVFLSELIIFVTAHKVGRFNGDMTRYFIMRVAIPTTINIISTVFCCIVIKKHLYTNRKRNYVAAFTTFIICSTISIFHNHYKFLLVMTGLPLIISAIFSNKKMIRSMVVCCFVTLTLSVFMMNFDKEPIIFFDVFTTIICAIAYIFLSFYVANAILRSQSEQIEYVFSITKRQLSLIKELKIEPLTKLYNRIALKEAVRSYIKKYHAGTINPHLVIIDLDHFKNVNDTYGHTSGDQVLIKVAEIIKESMGGIRRAFRYGGEEFVLLFEKESTEQVTEKIKEINQKLSNEVFDFDKKFKITLSAGLAKIKIEWDETAWFNAADFAMYNAKNSGRNKIIDYAFIPSEISQI